MARRLFQAEPKPREVQSSEDAPRPRDWREFVKNERVTEIETDLQKWARAGSNMAQAALDGLTDLKRKADPKFEELERAVYGTDYAQHTSTGPDRLLAELNPTRFQTANDPEVFTLCRELYGALHHHLNSDPARRETMGGLTDPDTLPTAAHYEQIQDRAGHFANNLVRTNTSPSPNLRQANRDMEGLDRLTELGQRLVIMTEHLNDPTSVPPTRAELMAAFGIAPGTAETEAERRFRTALATSLSQAQSSGEVARTLRAATESLHAHIADQRALGAKAYLAIQTRDTAAQAAATLETPDPQTDWWNAVVDDEPGSSLHTPAPRRTEYVDLNDPTGDELDNRSVLPGGPEDTLVTLTAPMTATPADAFPDNDWLGTGQPRRSIPKIAMTLPTLRLEAKEGEDEEEDTRSTSTEATPNRPVVIIQRVSKRNPFGTDDAPAPAPTQSGEQLPSDKWVTPTVLEDNTPWARASNWLSSTRSSVSNWSRNLWNRFTVADEVRDPWAEEPQGLRNSLRNWWHGRGTASPAAPNSGRKWAVLGGVLAGALLGNAIINQRTTPTYESTPSETRSADSVTSPAQINAPTEAQTAVQTQAPKLDTKGINTNTLWGQQYLAHGGDSLAASRASNDLVRANATEILATTGRVTVNPQDWKQLRNRLNDWGYGQFGNVHAHSFEAFRASVAPTDRAFVDAQVALTQHPEIGLRYTAN